jgi:hypothetical protein
MLARNLSIVFGLALVGASLTQPLAADQWNKKTVLTFGQRVQMPTTVLEPGTYVFKLLDSLSDRHIVQIFNSDESHLITTILAIPNYRLQPTGKSTFQFWETPAGQPTAMRAWFYPGDNFGQEFAYPKSLSLQIAKVAKTPVPTIVDEKAAEVAELKKAPLVIVDPTGNETPAAADTTVASNQSEASANTLAAQGSDRNTRLMAANSATPAALPHTASLYPLFGLLGLASLAAFGMMSRVFNRE